MITICVDVNGGDEKPAVVLEGIERALAANEDLCVLAAGTPDSGVEAFCESHDRATALVCSEAIGMDEHPTEAIRTKRDSTIVRGCAAVRAGEADGFFSAGSTGAIFAAATLHVGRVPGIKRPAIACAMPGLAGHETIFMDMGANADCRPEMIAQFAAMGSAYAKTELGVDNPRVALLSNGTEDTKGSESAQAAFAACKEVEGINFVGNCEGTDILMGDLDVIVTDGFTGNVALKTLEGTAKFLVGVLKEYASSSILSAMGALALKPALKEAAGKLSGDAHGGAVLLGLKAPVLIGHGATSPTAVCNGTLAAAAAVSSGLVERLTNAN